MTTQPLWVKLYIVTKLQAGAINSTLMERFESWLSWSIGFLSSAVRTSISDDKQKVNTDTVKKVTWNWSLLASRILLLALSSLECQRILFLCAQTRPVFKALSTCNWIAAHDNITLKNKDIKVFTVDCQSHAIFKSLFFIQQWNEMEVVRPKYLKDGVLFIDKESERRAWETFRKLEFRLTNKLKVDLSS